MAPTTFFPVTPKTARYIKLGVNNCWLDSARTNNRLEFGHRHVSHELAATLSKSSIAAVYTAQSRQQGKASDYAREVVDFYAQGEDCLWVTIAEGSLWWAFAKPEVTMMVETATNGSRYRKLLAPWSNQDANGNDLTIASLSTRLTKVAAYRQTICAIEAFDYLVRRINAVDEPGVAIAKTIQNDLTVAARSLIAGLHWRDFEVLCDLILTRSGWQRVSELGGLQKDTDLLRRMGRPSDIAGVVAFVASPVADYITGHDFAVNGGRTYA